jgi:antitoxin HicB
MKKIKNETKTLSYYMGLPYTVKLTPMESGGYFVKIEELPGCMSEGKTEKEALENIEDLKKTWLEAAIEDGYEIPLPEDMIEYSGRFVVRLPKYLHKNLSDRAKKEEISLNQLLVCLLSERLSTREILGKLESVRSEVCDTISSMREAYITKFDQSPDSDIANAITKISAVEEIPHEENWTA